MINDEDGRVQGAMEIDDNGMGHANTTTFASMTIASEQVGRGVLVVVFTVNTYQSGITCFVSCNYHYFSTTLNIALSFVTCNFCYG